MFVVDAAHSAQLVAKLKKFADENDAVVRYESVKQTIWQHHGRKKYHFFRPFRAEMPLMEHLYELTASLEVNMG